MGGVCPKNWQRFQQTLPVIINWGIQEVLAKWAAWTRRGQRHWVKQLRCLMITCWCTRRHTLIWTDELNPLFLQASRKGPMVIKTTLVWNTAHFSSLTPHTVKVFLMVLSVIIVTKENMLWRTAGTLRNADSCKRSSVNRMSAGSRLSWCIMDFFLLSATFQTYCPELNVFSRL